MLNQKNISVNELLHTSVLANFFSNVGITHLAFSFLVLEVTVHQKDPGILDTPDKQHGRDQVTLSYGIKIRVNFMLSYKIALANC